MSSLHDATLASVDKIAIEIVAPDAERVDREAAFPQQTVDAFRSAGLLGLLSATEVGGKAFGPRMVSQVIERVARECASSAMVLTMHFAGASVIEKAGSLDVRRALADGKHLSTLAFSEAGSRSQFWAPVSTASVEGDHVRLDAWKSWVTSASHATAYVWSSRASAGEGSSLWLVPRGTKGVGTHGGFDGLGLRGNDSLPVSGESVVLPLSARLGADGGGADLMLGVVLPWFNAMNAACSVGIMESAVARAIAHVTATRFTHTGSAVSDLPTIRAQIARMRVRTDMARTLWLDTLEALESGRADAQLRVLECKAACNDAALEVTDAAMRVCGGAAFRRDVGVERFFRDARAGSVMAPTADALYEFIGRAVCGMSLF